MSYIFLQALYGTFTKDWIKLPTLEEAKREARLFAARSGFPEPIWAAIDGTHILVNHCFAMFLWLLWLFSPKLGFFKTIIWRRLEIFTKTSHLKLVGTPCMWGKKFKKWGGKK